MAAPLLWLATKVGSRGKAINFLKKLYKGPISGYGEKIAKKGYGPAWGKDPITGKINTSGHAFKLSGKKAKFQRSAGKFIQGTAKRAAPVGAHLKKHRRAYGWGVTGAAAWDILDRDD
jgi:hypothetical protein